MNRVVENVVGFARRKPGAAAIALGGLAVTGGGAAIAIERLSHRQQRRNLRVPLPREIAILPTVSHLHFALNELGVYRRASSENFERWGVVLQRLDELEAMRRSALRSNRALMTSLQRAMRKREAIEAALRAFAAEIESRADELRLDKRIGSREAVESACEALVLHAKTCVDTVEFVAQRAVAARLIVRDPRTAVVDLAKADRERAIARRANEQAKFRIGGNVRRR